MQKVLYIEQVTEYAACLDERVTEYIGRQLTESFESFADFELLAFDWYDVASEETAVSQILIYVDREDLMFFCEDERAFDRCSKLLQEGCSNEKALYLFLVGLLKGDPARLEALEQEITDAEDAALKASRENYLDSILTYRRELLRLKRYYEQLDVILDNMVANDNQLFTKDGVRHFAIIHNRVQRFCSATLSLRDYVTQMREACQAQLDLEQNNLMRVFTVLTAVFLPLTLIVGWYGMNFANMPELKWQYGYPAVILFSVVVCVVLLVLFKRKRWY